MKQKIVKAITGLLKEIDGAATIYLDSIMQSQKDFYIVLSVVPSATENIGINVQNKAFLIDIALVDNRPDKQRIAFLVSQCEAFFNVIEIDDQQLQPTEYLPSSVDGIQHINFMLEFPQIIEWSEENG